MHELVADGTCTNGCCAIFQCAHCTYRCIQTTDLLPITGPSADPDLAMLLVRRGILNPGDPAADHEGSMQLAAETAAFGIPDDPLKAPERPARWRRPRRRRP